MIEAIELTKEYKQGHIALKGMNLKINPQEIYCLLGSNGAGKSTTINLFLDFIKPTSGKALINGKEVSVKGAETKADIAYIPENLMLYPYLSGLENLDFFCGLSGHTKNREELIELLIGSGLQEKFICERVKNYSKGMRQKVGIALTKAKEAKVLLLDEPTSGLDPKASNEFSDLLVEMKEKGLAILMATHDLFRARETGTQIGIMKEGSLLQSFSANEVSFKELEHIYLKHMH
ncbi:ABC transporter ATP-binding protein [Chryseobacterium sp.]|uniref:ABC transporter ATP-binding protein n=1 Tax=Chryseobacterium sp. TaxID=1871047 RepID=UPI0025C6ACA4|nr:ABC transporter ATP-binding protein [Chryseobacterium sp.]MBV8326811.1 ABC transporter ATP-binding protein [Chryseobacterium sp.]